MGGLPGGEAVSTYLKRVTGRSVQLAQGNASLRVNCKGFPERNSSLVAIWE